MSTSNGAEAESRGSPTPTPPEVDREQATAGEAVVVIGLIILCIAVVAFFIWLFWTFSGMIMDYTNTTKYGWVFQLVLTLIFFGFVGGGISIGKN